MIDKRRESIDPTAPAATYYTTGRNSSRPITRAHVTVSISE